MLLICCCVEDDNITLSIIYEQEITMNTKNINWDQLFTNKEQKQYHLGSIIYKQGTITISLGINYLQTRNNNNITRDQLFTDKEQY